MQKQIKKFIFPEFQKYIELAKDDSLKDSLEILTRMQKIKNLDDKNLILSLKNDDVGLLWALIKTGKLPLWEDLFKPETILETKIFTVTCKKCRKYFEINPLNYNDHIKYLNNELFICKKCNNQHIF